MAGLRCGSSALVGDQLRSPSSVRPPAPPALHTVENVA
jgi:hypothetical protein